jgi:preprotein translocase subunit SecE
MKKFAPIQYIIDIWGELKKVTWPTRTDVVKHTIIVIVSSIAAMAIVAALDFGLSKAIEYVISFNQ